MTGRKTRASSAEVRAVTQRERILSAAQKCFVEHGFHAASMAEIADVAGMSPGLIYRYFVSKAEIILAIIAHQLEVTRARIGQLHGSTDLVVAIVDSLDARGADEEPVSAALFLEMTADATRDPQIAAALVAFDATVRSDLAAWLARDERDGGRGLRSDVVPARALMLQCLIEGLRVRVAREPAIDKELLKEGLSEMVSALLAPPQPSTARRRRGQGFVRSM